MNFPPLTVFLHLFILLDSAAWMFLLFLVFDFSLLITLLLLYQIIK